MPYIVVNEQGSVAVKETRDPDAQFVSYGAMWKIVTGSKANQPVDTQDIIDAYNRTDDHA